LWKTSPKLDVLQKKDFQNITEVFNRPEKHGDNGEEFATDVSFIDLF